MLAQTLAEFQKQFFFGVNQIAEPLIRAGLGNPLLLPVGAVVVETTGRKTGRKINLPVLAARWGNALVFSTVRSEAQWVKNLQAHPGARYWLGGQAHEATAYVFTPTETPDLESLPAQFACLAQGLTWQSRACGLRIALLAPLV